MYSANFVTLQLESWFQRGPKKGSVPRPGSQSMSRPTSETDFGEIDDNDLKMYEREIDSMDEKQVIEKFEELLVSLQLFQISRVKTNDVIHICRTI